MGNLEQFPWVLTLRMTLKNKCQLVHHFVIILKPHGSQFWTICLILSFSRFILTICRKCPKLKCHGWGCRAAYHHQKGYLLYGFGQFHHCIYTVALPTIYHGRESCSYCCYSSHNKTIKTSMNYKFSISIIKNVNYFFWFMIFLF